MNEAENSVPGQKKKESAAKPETFGRSVVTCVFPAVSLCVGEKLLLQQESRGYMRKLRESTEGLLFCRPCMVFEI